MFEWVFDGIGTEIVSLAVGLLIGGISGYRIGLKNRATQKQNAGANSKQYQVGNITAVAQGEKEKKHDD